MWWESVWGPCKPSVNTMRARLSEALLDWEPGRDTGAPATADLLSSSLCLRGLQLSVEEGCSRECLGNPSLQPHLSHNLQVWEPLATS